jgi:hypothetical protein
VRKTLTGLGILAIIATSVSAWASDTEEWGEGQEATMSFETPTPGEDVNQRGRLDAVLKSAMPLAQAKAVMQQSADVKHISSISEDRLLIAVRSCWARSLKNISEMLGRDFDAGPQCRAKPIALYVVSRQQLKAQDFSIAPSKDGKWHLIDMRIRNNDKSVPSEILDSAVVAGETINARADKVYEFLQASVHRDNAVRNLETIRKSLDADLGSK